jgi:(2R)-3-sulfolactate dehydrogenase (NADP+)
VERKRQPGDFSAVDEAPACPDDAGDFQEKDDPMADDVTLSRSEAFDLARTALMRLGMVEAAAAALARAIVDAEAAGKPSVGFAHLLDYLHALVDGRIDGRAEPQITSPVAAIMKCDALGGIAK